MPKTFSSRRARLTAALTGKAKTVGPEEAHARNVLAITARIHKREARIREIGRELKRLRAQNRQDRRELRAVLQRNTDMGLDRATTGEPDAIDISNHHQENHKS